jgi:hypothetical protein
VLFLPLAYETIKSKLLALEDQFKRESLAAETNKKQVANPWLSLKPVDLAAPNS